MPKKSNRTILVTGATGKQGGGVLRHLRERGLTVRALTRDPNKADARNLVGHGTEVVRGDMENQQDLTRAMDGVHGVYSVQNPQEHGVEGEIRQGRNVVDAAKRLRVDQLVYSSVASADQNTGLPFFESKRQIEEHIRGTGLRYTILRPVFFMENLLALKDQIEQGTLALPLGTDIRLQVIAADDIGAFATMAFERPGHWQGRTVELAGDELSMNELAQTFSRITGREVQYRQVPWDEFDKQAGEAMGSLYRWLENTGYHVDIPILRQEYPNLMSLEKWLRAKWVKVQTA